MHARPYAYQSSARLAGEGDRFAQLASTSGTAVSSELYTHNLPSVHSSVKSKTMPGSPPIQLSKNPIALVLCQIRFSSILGMESTYLPNIQALLRVLGFKVNASGQIAQVLLTPQGPQAQVSPHHEFQNLDRTESVVVAPDFVTYQATRYVRFQDFLSRFITIIDQVSTVTKGLTIERIGLRYLDAIVPKSGETWQLYVQPGLRGIMSPIFNAPVNEQLHQVITGTRMGGTMIVRILANPKGIPLPPDLAGTKLSLSVCGPVIDGLGAAVIDMDHFCIMSPTDYDPGAIEKRLWDLKHGILEVWKDQIVTKEALERWA